MSDAVLVAYATRYGSTQAVAEQIAETLRESGFEVTLRSVEEVGSLEGYRAVVLGAPLYIGRWLKGARRFLQQHQEALQGRPVALFTLGPLRGVEEEWQEVRAQLDAELAKYPWLEPSAVELFGGKYDPAKLRFPDSVIARVPASPLQGMPESDLRDWEAIRAWTESVAAKLGEQFE